MVSPSLSVASPRFRFLRRVGCAFRVFSLNFLHDIREVLENSSLLVREGFNTQFPILTGKQWLQEVRLPTSDVEESPSWHQYAYYFSEVSFNVLPDVVWWIPHGTMEPMGMKEVSLSQIVVRV